MNDNVPDGIKNETHNTFSNSEKSWLMKLKYPAFFVNVKNYLGTDHFRWL
jgi:hypothetical protein